MAGWMFDTGWHHTTMKVLMILKKLAWICAGIILLPFTTFAVEPWADQTLPVKEGLEVWLDAAQENAARGDDGTRVMSGKPLGIWHDASGHGRHVQQPVREARPVFVQTPGHTTVR